MTDVARLEVLANQAMELARKEYVKDRSCNLRKGIVRIVATGEVGTYFWSAPMPRIAGRKWTHAVAMSDEKLPNGKYKDVRWLDVSEIEMAYVDTDSECAQGAIQDRAAKIFNKMIDAEGIFSKKDENVAI